MNETGRRANCHGVLRLDRTGVSAQADQMLRIDIYSDTVCPWCYIGKRRLERAIASRSELQVEISWRAFQLNPNMPTSGVLWANYLATKFGAPERAESVFAAITRAGHSERIAFDFAAISQMPNTVQSHRLLRFAERFGRQDTMMEALFRAYFLDGEDIGDIETLARVAAVCGLDGLAAMAFLEGDEERNAVLSEDMRARRMGINAVPCYIVNGAYALSGAQEPEAFYPLFDLAEVVISVG